jgi:hypothetical protein
MKIILGIGLMLVAFVAMTLFITENPAAAQLQQSLLCQPGEQIEQVTGGRSCDSFGRNCGTSFTYNCVNAAGTARDVTLPTIGLLVGSFAGPFVIGLLLLMWGILGGVRRANRRVMTTATDWFGQTSNSGQPGSGVVFKTIEPGQTATFISMNGQPVNPGDLPPETAAKLQSVMNMLGTSMNAVNSTPQASLVAQLEQLQQARDKGLISQSEYDQLRQEILDKLA